MPAAKKICRVCGKEYEVCRTQTPGVTLFRWQDVACSPECGAEYLRRVTEARMEQTKQEPEQATAFVAEEQIEVSVPKRTRRKKGQTANVAAGTEA